MCDSYQELLQCSLGVTAEALSIANLGKMLNERYLHHHMSHQLQEQCGLLELHNPGIRPLLHPEWPTWKKSTGLEYGQYQRRSGEGELKTKKTFPVKKEKGGAGFIDFALGDYACPTIAIEVTTKFGWCHEEVIYDMMKLIDGRNSSFKAVISCNIILRENGLAENGLAENGLAENGYKTRLRLRMNQALAKARDRLWGYLCNDGRKIFFFASEIASDSRRYWFYESHSDEFIESEQLPPILSDTINN
ncbi:hypothetical protein [Gimesia chilikensis]|uniref:Restriction endonuclease n=1 Tax=Gimesia chilikensis TaxID=2605989 RepID=A0A517PVX2_9PLAN|nr:hypothetical protein [Gimesia chilikensis]QDT23523.1 hypothetical protein HG66A1_53440 [Gimesia chilikensis]